MADNSEDSMVEEREEWMVSPTGGNPFLRKAHFLKPTSPFSSINENEPPLKLPPHSFSSLPPPHFEPKKKKKWPLKVKFQGWQGQPEKWITWVERLAAVHKSTWKKAGIFEAIFNSTYDIRPQTNLVHGLAEKWCCETNTFIFPWGEATITLEDVMVLGGFSVSGDSVLCPLETTELKEIEAKLNRERQLNCKGDQRSLKVYEWMNKYRNSGDEFEHEAFLAYWLSRYVFPGAGQAIFKDYITIAIHLARGTRIALAPAVLACIYRDLGLLKIKIVASNNLKIGDADLQAIIRSPFQLIQVWAWERFLELRPNPNPIKSGDIRMARWDKVNRLKVENLRRVLDSAGDNFLWRPYTLDVIENWHLPKYYPQKEMPVLVGPQLDDELLSFVRCLRVSELVGLGTVEPYLPHRVAMQFGYDQEIPCSVTRHNHNSDIAWKDYIMEMENVKLYLPSRLFEADVTTKYLKWRKQSVPALEEAISAAVPRKKRTKRRMSTKWLLLKVNHPSVPPGFAPKRKRTEAEDEDKLTIAEPLKYRKKVETFGIRQSSGSEKLSGQVHNCALVAEGSSVNTVKSDENIVRIVGNESASSSCLFEKQLLELKARCKMLESEVHLLKRHTFGNH